MMSIFLTSDWQLSPNPRDAYRLKFLPWLVEQVREENLKGEQVSVWILGDLTEQKDGHPGWLVNHIVKHLVRIAEYANIEIIPGNHDGPNMQNIFFEFAGLLRNATFHRGSKNNGRGILWLPYTQDAGKDWISDLFADVHLILAHQEFKGAVLNSKKVSSATTPVPDHPYLLFSGHIHTPQVLNIGQGRVVYVGSPYPVDFGDDFKGGVISLKLNPRDLTKSEFKRIPYPGAPKRVVVLFSPRDIEVGAHRALRSYIMGNGLGIGDQVKFRVTLTPELLNGVWPEFRTELMDECSNKGVEVFGLDATLETTSGGKEEYLERESFGSGTAEDIFARYLEREGIDIQTELAQLGLSIVRQVPTPELVEEEG